MVRQYVTTMMTRGMKKATKEPISMKRSSLRTQLPLTKTLSSLWRPITGIGIDTPKRRQRERLQSFSFWQAAVWLQNCFYLFQADHKNVIWRRSESERKKEGGFIIGWKWGNITVIISQIVVALHKNINNYMEPMVKSFYYHSKHFLICFKTDLSKTWSSLSEKRSIKPWSTKITTWN